MSKKNLLSESQVRKFMKLAKLEPLSSGFVHGLTERTDEDLEEGHGRGSQEYNKEQHRGGGMAPGNTKLNEKDEEAELHATEDELGDMDAEADREGDEIDDLEADLDAADAGDGRMVDVDDFLSALESALEGALGDEVEIDASELDDGDEVEADVELDAELDMGGEDVDVDVEDEMLQEEEGSKWKDGEHEYKRRGKSKKHPVGHRAGEVKGPDGKMHYKTGEVNEEQGADDREDEHLGMEDGPERDHQQSMKDRRVTPFLLRKAPSPRTSLSSRSPSVLLPAF